MAEAKTQPTKASVKKFLDGIQDETKRQDCLELVKMMKQITKAEPQMWGPSIVGFGSYHYKYASGREGDWFLTGFSPRKRDLTVYIMPGLREYDDLLAKLGKHKTGVSCLYLKRLEDVDKKVLKQLIRDSVKNVSKSQS